MASDVVQPIDIFPLLISSINMYNVCLVGSGGVGTIASLALEKSGRAKVTSVIRSQFSAVKQNGFNIDSVDHGSLRNWRPSKVVASVKDAASEQNSPYDFVVVTLKQVPELYSVPEIIKPIVSFGVTAIVLMQNGIDIELPVISAFPGCCIMSAVSMIGVEQHGTAVTQTRHDEFFLGAHIHSGLDHTIQVEKAKLFVDIYNGCGAARAELANDILTSRWFKVLWNGTYNTLCALTRMDVGTLQTAGARESIIIPGMVEMYNIAIASGIILSRKSIEDLAFKFPDDSPFRPSMLVDIEKRRPMELEVILGAPLARAKKLDISTPCLSMVYEILKLQQWQLLQLSTRSIP